DPTLRVEALYSLESWPDASTLDPMDGRHFPVPQGNPEVLGQVVGPEIWSLAHDSHDKVSRRVIALLRKIEPSTAQLDRVAGFVLDEKQRSSIRIEWLRWLRKQKIDLFSSVGVQALASKSVELRVAASQELIGAKRGRGEVAEYVMGALQKSSDSSELQQAIKMVQRLPARNAIVTRLADELFAGSIAPSVQLEVFEVAKALSKQDKSLQEKLERHQAKTAQAGIMATYGMSLVGGNVEKGRRIFQGHAQAQCAKCHALKQTDKQVGPSLEGIAKRHPPEYLLRSIVDPQADLVPGYGIITLQLKNDQTVAGNLIGRDDQSITVKLPDGAIQTIARSEVKSESKPVGTMPDVRSFLDPRQVRDLVAYLATLK
ncbi:MAG: c-type cytochrome, partial [Opitutae bacterium]|nr:c-type cytochrome [Opitutae bacterium]